MKTMKWIFLATLTLTTCFALQAAAPQASKAQYNDNPPYNFHGEIDNTDIYAIPLDNSEESQEEELESFEQYSEKHQPK